MAHQALLILQKLDSNQQLLVDETNELPLLFFAIFYQTARFIPQTHPVAIVFLSIGFNTEKFLIVTPRLLVNKHLLLSGLVALWLVDKKLNVLFSPESINKFNELISSSFFWKVAYSIPPRKFFFNI